MVGTSGLLLAIDLVFPPNDGALGMDWALIPIAALLTFGVLIPIVTKFGRKKEKPIEKLSLLKYHEWGKHKYKYLDRKYPLTDALSIDDEQLQEYKNILESYKLKVTIDY